MPDRFLAPSPAEPVQPGPAPSFSIVIPAYEAAATVRAAVESALAQTYPAREVIVVDDGSTDDPRAALSGLEEQITILRKDNGGGASALNVGCAAATSTFMAILDADDAYHPRRLEAMAELAAARPDLDLVTTDARFVVAGAEAGTLASVNRFATTDQRTAIFRTCFLGSWPAIRLSRLRAIGGFDESLRIAYDWDCWLRLILNGAQVGMVDQPYLDYCVRSDSLSGNRLGALWDRVRVLERARRNPDLRADELPALEGALRYHRSRAALAQAEVELAGPRLPRLRLARMAASRDVTMRARAVLALTALSATLGRRLVPKDPGRLGAPPES